jgi:hypothetical protein
VESSAPSGIVELQALTATLANWTGADTGYAYSAIKLTVDKVTKMEARTAAARALEAILVDVFIWISWGGAPKCVVDGVNYRRAPCLAS